ncbi:23S rRNA (adenine(1618)-N(6))-methyltransferase RlmF [Propionivibrio sp.]|uniref:23S rRNA (adenine(1618)-N(6))-methyltransferase RlmF n=1 Tax=Propionivibrio sp. TaxID=2212460 RepID=UPI003BF38C31
MPKKPAGETPAKKIPRAAAAEKTGLHPRNKHRGRYDFKQLVECCPELAVFVALNAYGDASIDFANPDAVRALNRALLKQIYGVTGWDLPPQYLCPPIPGRADYLHYLADLLAISNGGVVPCGEAIRVLDIGVGANCVYPLIGHGEYGWHFVGTDIDRAALASAQITVDANSGHRDAIELRFQPSRSAIFKGVLQADELFDLVMCNPPFHASLDAARTGSERKWKNLGKSSPSEKEPTLNFGGQGDELCCVGGEEGFVSRMIAESMQISNSCLWFTALVSKSSSLPAVYRALKKADVQDSQTIEMAQGQKKSRIVAWTFLNERQRQAWRNQRRGESS